MCANIYETVPSLLPPFQYLVLLFGFHPYIPRVFLASPGFEPSVAAPAACDSDSPIIIIYI